MSEAAQGHRLLMN